MELDREEIVKALECCYDNNLGCIGCPFQDPNKYFECSNLTTYAVFLVKKLNEEVEDLKAIAEQYRKQFEDCGEDRAKLTEENERLSGKVAEYEEERKYHFEMSRKRIAETKADTVREFVERLHERFGSDSNRVYSNYNIHRYIDQIANEMIGQI